MPVELGTKRKRLTARLWRVEETVPDEILVYCPACKALDVLRFSGRKMIPTRKFTEKRGRFFHDCGATSPCRLHSLGGHRHPAG